jgi:membrane-associated phospholipid phosphatase
MYSTAFLLSLWQNLVEWDKWLFLKLNRDWTNPVFDAIFPFIRNSSFWVPLYIFVLVFMISNFGKKGLLWCLLFICTVAITDVIGFQVLKENIERLRPCQDPMFSDSVRLLLRKCSTTSSFVSNHAANHFGIATFAVFTFRGLFKKWMYLAYVWAFFIGYAQVYVGVHYPLDVLGGAVLGMIVGSVTAWGFRMRWGKFEKSY